MEQSSRVLGEVKRIGGRNRGRGEEKGKEKWEEQREGKGRERRGDAGEEE